MMKNTEQTDHQSPTETKTTDPVVVVFDLLLGIPGLIIASNLLQKQDLRYWPKGIPEDMAPLFGFVILLISAYLLMQVFIQWSRERQ